METNLISRAFRISLTILLGIFASGCNKPTEQTVPEQEQKDAVITGEVSSISAFSATFSGTVKPTHEMGEIRFGILVSEKEDFGYDGSIDLPSKELNSQNQFKVTTDRLKPDTKYYFKAYLYYGGAYRYGRAKSFKTFTVSFSVLTQKETEVTSRSVTFNGKVSIGQEFMSGLEVGFHYANSEKDLTSGKDKYTKGEKGENDAFSKTVEGLKPATTYYYRASATYDEYEVYGDIRSFTTDDDDVPPQSDEIMTGDANDIGSFSATLVGEAHPTSEMGSILLGFLISDQEEPDRSNSMDLSTQELDKQNLFKVKADQLMPETRYYYKAYILYGGIYHYGEIRSFETAPALSVTTGSAADITFSTAVLNGSATVLATYPSAGLRVGFVYSVYAESVSEEALEGDDVPSDFHAILCDRKANGSFSGTADGLTPNCLYYYRAFAAYDDDSYWKFGEIRTFHSLEDPGLREVPDWSIKYDGRVDYTESDGTVSRLESFHFKYTGNNYFFIRTVTPEEINTSFNGDIKAYFDNQAGVLASRAQNQGVSVSELRGVFDKYDSSSYFDMLIHGNYTAYLIEITADGVATGNYSKCPCIVVEEAPTEGFRRWIGRWRVSDGYSAFYIDISSCEANYLYYVNGWETGSGVTVQMNGSDDWFYARYRKEDGMMSFYGQDIVSYVDQKYSSNADKVFAGGYVFNGINYIDVEGVDNLYDISHTVFKAGTITLVPESFDLTDGATVTYNTMQYFKYIYNNQKWYTFNSSGVPSFTGRTVSMAGVDASGAPGQARAAVPRELTKAREVLRVHQDKGSTRRAPTHRIGFR